MYLSLPLYCRGGQGSGLNKHILLASWLACTSYFAVPLRCMQAGGAGGQRAAAGAAAARARAATRAGTVPPAAAAPAAAAGVSAGGGASASSHVHCRGCGQDGKWQWARGSSGQQPPAQPSGAPSPIAACARIRCPCCTARAPAVPVLWPEVSSLPAGSPCCCGHVCMHAHAHSMHVHTFTQVLIHV